MLRRLRVLATVLLAILFAAGGLLHPPMMARGAAPAMDCHVSSESTAPGDAHREDGAGGRALPDLMPSGCPLANLPPTPDARVALAVRDGVRTAYALPAVAILRPVALDPADPPPRPAT